MENQKIEAIMAKISGNLPANQLDDVRERLQEVDDSHYLALISADLKNPIKTLIFAILLGWVGADHFTLKQVGLGILKLIVYLGWVIWWIVGAILVVGAAFHGGFNFALFLYRALGWIVLAWYVFDIIMAIPNTKKYNYKKFVKLL
ncbi:MAG: TM2 domain-containing protein [Prevotella sp.]|nr:TM2 domain-containing protein [Prevotella sp.]